MATAPGNRVRERREAHGLSQVALAECARLTRQSIGAIEAGRVTPSVDVALRLAQALACSVEALFGGDKDESLVAERAESGRGDRVLVARIRERWVSHPLQEDHAQLAADGLVRARHRARVEVAPLRSLPELHDNVVLMGCANALGVLTERLNVSRGAGRFTWLSRSSGAALEALRRQTIHVAGLHLVDSRTDEANVPFVRRIGYPEPVQLVTLGRWEVGLVVRAEPRRAIRRVADLARPGLRLVAREPGSGAQRLLERTLTTLELPAAWAKQPHLRARGHFDVARLVALGVADTGVATRDAALAFGLAFVPLTTERFDLAVPASTLRDERLQRMFGVLTSGAFRRELESLGYEASAAGERVAEVAA